MGIPVWLAQGNRLASVWWTVGLDVFDDPRVAASSRARDGQISTIPRWNCDGTPIGFLLPPRLGELNRFRVLRKRSTKT